jgi:hypothetical protein
MQFATLSQAKATGWRFIATRRDPLARRSWFGAGGVRNMNETGGGAQCRARLAAPVFGDVAVQSATGVLECQPCAFGLFVDQIEVLRPRVQLADCVVQPVDGFVIDPDIRLEA